jgi:hypothetical protein
MFLETERLALKVLRRDKEALRRLAEREGEAMSVVLRRLIRQEAIRRGVMPSNGDTELTQEVPYG